MISNNSIRRLTLLLLPICALTAQIVPRTPTNPASLNNSTATMVYDSRLREFRCWSEGTLRPDARQHLCETDAGWHPVNANLYFVRGQSVNVLVMNGIAEDIFSLDV